MFCVLCFSIEVPLKNKLVSETCRHYYNIACKLCVFSSGKFCLHIPFSDADRDKLAESSGKFAQYMCKILDVYFGYHHDAYSTKGFFKELLIRRIARLYVFADINSTKRRCLSSRPNNYSCCCWSFVDNLCGRCCSCPNSGHYKGANIVL